MAPAVNSFFGVGWREPGSGLPAGEESQSIAEEALEMGYVKSLSPEQRGTYLDALKRDGKDSRALAVALILAQLDEWGE